MAVYIYTLLHANHDGHQVLATIDDSIIIEEIERTKDGVMKIRFLTELFALEYLKFIAGCFEKDSSLENVKAIEFEINKVKFHCTKENAIFEKMKRHFWKNTGAKAPEDYE